MLDNTFDPQTGRVTLLYLAQLALALAGLALLLGLKPYSGRLLLLGVFLAAASTLVAN